MTRWDRVELGRVAKIVRSSVSPDELSPDTAYLGLEHLQRGGRIIGSSTVAAEELLSSKFQFDSGDILYGKLRPYLAKISAPDFSGVCSTDILPVRPGANLDSRYLLHWLRQPSMVKFASARAKGANLPRLAPSELARFGILLPPLAEQKRIAAVLDQVDALRAKRREAIALLDDLAQHIFLDMFSGDRIPVRGRLGDHLAFITSGGRGWAKYYSESGSRFIRSLDVRMNEIWSDGAAFIQAPDDAEARRTRIESGDVLLTITGSRIGRVAPVPSGLEGAYVSQHVAILRPDHAKMKAEYLSWFLSLPSEGQRQIEKMQYGQSKPGLNFRQISDFSIPVPEVPAQEKFVERVRSVGALQNVHRTHLATLDELFESLQQRGFAGQLWDHEAA
ncbi:restriction endonuclease subunit S [Streptomyces sp. NPDC056638]|uniref:restriction endonuclease subunit S n=1 Tax=Streptomyces sp. NPDC056638 TaxID=3345887 RepID=UPI0036970100